MEKHDSSRRKFMSKFAPATFLGAIGLWGGSLVRSAMPTFLPQESKRIKLGLPTDYPPGTVKVFDEDRVIIFSDDEGMYAVSTTCTHLGCVVTWTGSKFTCPCHGSQFDSSGEVLAGPAPKALNWHKIEKLPTGQLAVNLSSFVDHGYKESIHA